MALKGKTMGIIGTGRIGQNVARIASLGFLMDVIAHDPYPDEDAARQNHFKYAGLDQVWEKSDIISLHCPLLPETRHLISDNSLAKMKDGVVLINTSRGQVIETKALVRALKSGKVAHAFLDVLEHEKNISENEELVKLKGTVTTPHIAFYADDSMHKMYAESFAAIKRFLDGEELVHEVSGV
jgi:D-lactate dehydrogenase